MINDTDDIRLILAKNLEYLMRINGVGQSELEKKTINFGKVNQRTISSYLKTNGELGNATIIKVQAIAKVFKLSVSELLDPSLHCRTYVKIDDSVFMKDLISFCVKESTELLVEAGMLAPESANTVLETIDDISTASVLILRHKTIDKATGDLAEAFNSYLSKEKGM